MRSQIFIGLAVLFLLAEQSFAQGPDPITIDHYSSVDHSDCSDEAEFFEGVFDALYHNAADASAQLPNRLEAIRKIRDMAFVVHECTDGSDWMSSEWVYGWYAIQKLGDLIVVSRSISDTTNRDAIQLQAAQALLDIASNYRFQHFGWYNTVALSFSSYENYYARPVEAIDAVVRSFCIHSLTLKDNAWSVQWGKPVVSDDVLNLIIERLRNGIAAQETMPELRSFSLMAANLLENLNNLGEPANPKQIDFYMRRYFYPEGAPWMADIDLRLLQENSFLP